MFSIITPKIKSSMQQSRNVASIFFSMILFCGSLYAETRSINNDWEYVFSGVFKPESFYARNSNWLNNDNDFDKSYYSRHSLDLMIDILYGAKTYGTKVAEFMFQVRNKGV